MTRGNIKQLVTSLTSLRELYNHAIDDGGVTANPIAKVGMIVKGCQVTSAHIDPLTTEDVKALLAAARERFSLFYPLFLCAVRTGMRQGELIGLRWEDIDFHGRFIEVRHNALRRQETSTKTKKIRRVDLSPQLGKRLLRLKETRQLEVSMKGFYACLEATGLRCVRFHDLRHTLPVY